jgi:hypothetical protein
MILTDDIHSVPEANVMYSAVSTSKLLTVKMSTKVSTLRFETDVRETRCVCPKLTKNVAQPRVARSVLVQTNQNGKKYTKGPQTTPDGHTLYKMVKLYQMAQKYTNIFHSKAL